MTNKNKASFLPPQNSRSQTQWFTIIISTMTVKTGGVGEEEANLRLRLDKTTKPELLICCHLASKLVINSSKAYPKKGLCIPLTFASFT